MAAIIIGIISLTVMWRVIWFCSHFIETRSFQTKLLIPMLQSYLKGPCVLYSLGMTNSVPFQNEPKNLHQAKLDCISTDKLMWWCCSFAIFSSRNAFLKNALPGQMTVQACWNVPISDSKISNSLCVQDFHLSHFIKVIRILSSFSLGNLNSWWWVSNYSQENNAVLLVFLILMAPLDLGLSQICSKICLKCFWKFPKILPIITFMLPIMRALCYNMNNTDVKILLLECSIRVFMIWE